jgi:hypothetical protein
MTELTDLDIGSLCLALYSDQPDGFWDYFWPHDGGYVAIKRVGDVDVLIWRGSSTTLDWLDDLDTIPIVDPILGSVHKGFFLGASGMWPQVDKVLQAKVIVVGHSLGAGHASIYAGHMVAALHKMPVRVVLFGSPRPGFQKLSDILAPVTINSYKNRSDPVTDVPLYIEPDFLYVEPRPFIALDVAPPFQDSWGLFSDHHMQLYHTALQGLYRPSGLLPAEAPNLA